MTLACAIVCEDRADRDIACDLADRVICESVEWIEVAALSTFRRWQGLRSGDEFLKWKDVPARAKACGIQVYGGFEGRPAAMDEHAARKAMLLFLHPSNERPAVILLIRDDDGHAERRVGMSNARDAESLRLRIPVVLGIATTKREAWVLAGLVCLGSA